VLLTTRGRKIGLPREVLLPCERTPDGLIMLSTYGWRSNWIRNIQHDANVTITAGGWVLSGHAELVEELERKIHLASEHPFFPAAPFCADPRSSSHTATPSPGHVPAEVGSPAPACCRSSV
jgi:deazaflavin-dependent oxidoreductase (nitroreductase family)